VQELAIRQESGFAELVERVNAHLDHEEQQEDSGDLKESPHVDQVSKLGPAKCKRDRGE